MTRHTVDPSNSERSSWFIVIEHPDKIKPRKRANKGFTYNLQTQKITGDTNETGNRNPDIAHAQTSGSKGNGAANEIELESRNSEQRQQIKTDVIRKKNGEDAILGSDKDKTHGETKSIRSKTSERTNSECYEFEQNKIKSNEKPEKKSGTEANHGVQGSHEKEKISSLGPKSLPAISEPIRCQKGGYDKPLTSLKRPRLSNRIFSGAEKQNCTHLNKNTLSTGQQESGPENSNPNMANKPIASTESEFSLNGKRSRKPRLRETCSAQYKSRKLQPTTGSEDNQSASHVEEKALLSYKKQKRLLTKYECEDSDTESESDNDENLSLLQRYKKMKLRIPLI